MLGRQKHVLTQSPTPFACTPPRDASLLLTIEDLLLTVRLFTYGAGTVSKTDQTQFPDGGGGAVSKTKKKTNRFSTVSKKDQTKFQP